MQVPGDYSEIRELIVSIWCKDDLLQQWKGYMFSLHSILRNICFINFIQTLWSSVWVP